MNNKLKQNTRIPNVEYPPSEINRIPKGIKNNKLPQLKKLKTILTMV